MIIDAISSLYIFESGFLATCVRSENILEYSHFDDRSTNGKLCFSEIDLILLVNSFCNIGDKVSRYPFVYGGMYTITSIWFCFKIPKIKYRRLVRYCNFHACIVIDFFLVRTSQWFFPYPQSNCTLARNQSTQPA